MIQLTNKRNSKLTLCLKLSSLQRISSDKCLFYFSAPGGCEPGESGSERNTPDSSFEHLDPPAAKCALLKLSNIIRSSLSARLSG